MVSDLLGLIFAILIFVAFGSAVLIMIGFHGFYTNFRLREMGRFHPVLFLAVVIPLTILLVRPDAYSLAGYAALLALFLLNSIFVVIGLSIHRLRKYFEGKRFSALLTVTSLDFMFGGILLPMSMIIPWIGANPIISSLFMALMVVFWAELILRAVLTFVLYDLFSSFTGGARWLANDGTKSKERTIIEHAQ